MLLGKQDTHSENACHVLFSCRCDPAPEWQRNPLMWDTSGSSSIPRSMVMCYASLSVTGKEQFKGESNMSLLYQEGFSVVLKGSSWHLPMAHLPEKHQGVPQTWLTAEQTKWRLMFFFMLWSASFYWQYFVKSPLQRPKKLWRDKQQPYRNGL